MAEVKEKALHTPMVGEHPTMRRLRELVVAVGRRECTALIRGESGTARNCWRGRFIWPAPARPGRLFPSIAQPSATPCWNPNSLAMFAALYGAACNTLGFFRAADGGTIFLDEIGELFARSAGPIAPMPAGTRGGPAGTFRAIPVNGGSSRRRIDRWRKWSGKTRFESTVFPSQCGGPGDPSPSESQGGYPLWPSSFFATWAGSMTNPSQNLDGRAEAIGRI